MIVLDTHAWIWWVSEPDRLSDRARVAIDYADVVGVSPISAWETAMMVAKGRIAIDRDPGVWLTQALARPRVEVAALSAEIALAAGLLGSEDFYGDPADRMIAATAIALGAELVTKDRRIRSFPGVRTVW